MVGAIMALEVSAVGKCSLGSRKHCFKVHSLAALGMPQAKPQENRHNEEVCFVWIEGSPWMVAKRCFRKEVVIPVLETAPTLELCRRTVMQPLESGVCIGVEADA